MDLLNFRIIGHHAIPDSSWLKVSRGLNVLRTCDADQGPALLHMLQTINPPYDLVQMQPFADFPAYTTGQYAIRKIIPSKKTAALAIFAATPRLVQELTVIDPLFYETDRIEFGRRRDLSRWINFVELAGATRWSEIESSVSLLLSCLGPDAAAAAARLQTIMGQLRGSDRIGDERAGRLREALSMLRNSLPEDSQALLDQCLQAVDRAHFFQQAKEIVVARLPLFLSITGGETGQYGRGFHANEKGNPDPFAFLADELRKRHTDPTALARCLQRINMELNTLHPERALCFRADENGIRVERVKGTTPYPITDLHPVEQFEVTLSVLTGLHKELQGSLPIALIDCKALQLQQQERSDLLDVLLRHASRLQFLVAPDSSFLEICAEALEKIQTGGPSFLTFIDVPCKQFNYS